MSAIRQYFSEVIQEAQLKDSGYEEFLFTLLEKEWDKRQQSAMESRIAFTHRFFRSGHKFKFIAARVNNSEHKEQSTHINMHQLQEEQHTHLHLICSYLYSE